MLRKWLVVFCVFAAAAAGSARADQAATHPVFDKLAPESLDDLRAIESRVQAITARAAAATVSLDLVFEDDWGRKRSAGTGSGVVVGTEGYILTAAHVIGEAGKQVEVLFPDGRTETAVTLGSDKLNDAGLVKLQGQGPWPHVEMAESDTLNYGDWVVALGHPGGFDIERSVVVRLGRVVRVRYSALQSDCSLIGGDSGGPLFDMNGRVVGIHSRIGRNERTNIHVPISEYHIYWDRLAAARVPVVLGIRVEDDARARGVEITTVTPGSAAAQAGLRVGDVIDTIDDQTVRSQRDVTDILNFKTPGDTIALDVIRGARTIRVEARLRGRE